MGSCYSLRDPPAGRDPPPGKAATSAGPSTDYPVSGVDWYEAAAYAEFAGKSLPTVTQWYQAAPTDFAVYSIGQSNFSARGPWRVGNSPNVGPFGTYDMSGNMREWSFNTIEKDRRFILGGAWRTQTYQAMEPEALPPFDRSRLNGFRCVRNSQPLPANATAPLEGYERDFTKAKPVYWMGFFKPTRRCTPTIETRSTPRVKASWRTRRIWTKEKITIDAGYGNERCRSRPDVGPLAAAERAHQHGPDHYAATDRLGGLGTTRRAGAHQIITSS